MIAHYCDCRFKGRQPGTRRNVDPTKKKRQRTPRPLNLCDCKIKIVEHFATGVVPQHPVDPNAPAGAFVPGHATTELFGMLTPSGTLPPDHPALNGGKYYTIERIHSNGCDGVGECVSCSHRHALELSDQTKSNFVVRTQLKAEKERKQLEVSLPGLVYTLTLHVIFSIFWQRYCVVASSLVGNGRVREQARAQRRRRRTSLRGFFRDPPRHFESHLPLT